MSGNNDSAKKKIQIEYHWAIKHTRGWTALYYGTYCTRKEAIEDHARKKGISWKKCYRQGDRAVRVAITDDLLSLLQEAQRGLHP